MIRQSLGICLLLLTTASISVGNAQTEPAAATAPAGLVITTVKPGDGAEAKPGSTVVVHYTGWLYDPAAADKKGAKFDSSVDRQQPFDFPLGAGRVIAGWDQGVAGMRVGETRVLMIPAGLAYGSQGAGGVIPPNATLIFEVQLLEVR